MDSIIILLGILEHPEEVMREVLLALYPQYANVTGAVYGVKNVFQFSIIFTIIHATVPITPVYIAILVIGTKIFRYLNLQNTMSQRTKAMHRQLLKALIFQACLPSLFLIAVLAYATEQLHIYHHPLLEHSVFLVIGFIPMLTPLSSLVFIRPYRDWIYRVVFKSRRRNGSGTLALPQNVSMMFRKATTM
ncbi:hypothetical protein ANCDUO_10659 [Ancylostoma duodenale]|uniref:7TM chemoreceptor n=1 Tax=Ancylostoma duodenale TaxID=51022 RepID=A0A0C2GJR7_9BILA|nr:hypothetical protein ANCDUO_10659 [Ancylostoma duodenale]